MNKSDLVNKLAASTGLSKVKAAEAVDALFGNRGIIPVSLARGEKVTITGFGNFTSRDRAARDGVNPANGQKIRIAAKRVPGFTAGKSFRDTVAGA